MTIGILSIHIYLPACTSLKQKRSHIKPILARLHREFNVSAAEVDLQDVWQESLIACAMIGNDGRFLQRALEEVRSFFSMTWLDIELLEHHIELL